MREKYRRLKEIEKEISETFDELLELRKDVFGLWEIKYQEKCEECEILKSDKKELEYEVECLKSDKEELEYHIDTLNEKIEKIYEDRNENYRHIEYASQI